MSMPFYRSRACNIREIVPFVGMYVVEIQQMSVNLNHFCFRRSSAGKYILSHHGFFATQRSQPPSARCRPKQGYSSWRNSTQSQGCERPWRDGSLWGPKWRRNGCHDVCCWSCKLVLAWTVHLLDCFVWQMSAESLQGTLTQREGYCLLCILWQRWSCGIRARSVIHLDKIWDLIRHLLDLPFTCFTYLLFCYQSAQTQQWAYDCGELQSFLKYVCFADLICSNRGFPQIDRWGGGWCFRRCCQYWINPNGCEDITSRFTNRYLRANDTTTLAS